MTAEGATPALTKLSTLRSKKSDCGTKYEALSYVWGEPSFTLPIFLNGTTFNVTTNLEEALRYLRLPTEERIVWIDAISINQSDIDERGEQVGYMGEIYRGCTVDLLWLGEEGQDSRFEKAVQIMDLFAKGDIPASGWVSYLWRDRVVREGEEGRDQRTWSMDLDDLVGSAQQPQYLEESVDRVIFPFLVIELGKAAYLPEVSSWPAWARWETPWLAAFSSYLQLRNYMPDEVLKVQDQEKKDDETASPEGIMNNALYEAFWRTVSVDCKVYPTIRLTTSDIQHDLAILKGLPKFAPGAEVDGTERETQLMMRNTLAGLKIGKSYRNISTNMRFATLGSGQYAMVPLETKDGDSVVALRGAKVPAVARAADVPDRESKDDLFTIVGVAYVHGFMDGEARVQVEEGFLEEKIFTLA